MKKHFFSTGPPIISSVIIALRDLLPMVGLQVGMATSDAAGCNWLSYRDTLSTNTFGDALSHDILDEYPTVDFNDRPHYKSVDYIFAHLLSFLRQRFPELI